MQESLLERLAEPATHNSLTLEATEWSGSRIESGTLLAKDSGRRYPIVRGIPRFVEDEGYTGSFGLQWNRFRSAQLDSSNGQRYSQNRFFTETLFRPQELAGKYILDGGCGAGRFAEVAASTGANVVALDYSSAIDAAQETVKRFSNIDLVQGNLLEPPFRPGAFDFVYSIGVVQHTPNPAAVIRNLISVLRPGGKFSLTIYGRRPWTKLNTKYLIRPLTKRLPAPLLLRLLKVVMPVVFPLTSRMFRLPYLGKLARFTIPVASYDRPDFSYEQQYEEAVLDTFDMLSPWYDSPMTSGEVAAVLNEAEVATYSFLTKTPVNVIGER